MGGSASIAQKEAWKEKDRILAERASSLDAREKALQEELQQELDLKKKKLEDSIKEHEEALEKKHEMEEEELKKKERALKDHEEELKQLQSKLEEELKKKEEQKRKLEDDYKKKEADVTRIMLDWQQKRDDAVLAKKRLESDMAVQKQVWAEQETAKEEELKGREEALLKAQREEEHEKEELEKMREALEEAQAAWLEEKRERQDDLSRQEEDLMRTRDEWYIQMAKDEEEKKSKDEVFAAMKEAFGGDDPTDEELGYANTMLHSNKYMWAEDGEEDVSGERRLEVVLKRMIERRRSPLPADRFFALLTAEEIDERACLAIIHGGFDINGSFCSSEESYDGFPLLLRITHEVVKSSPDETEIRARSVKAVEWILSQEGADPNACVAAGFDNFRFTALGDLYGNNCSYPEAYAIGELMINAKIPLSPFHSLRMYANSKIMAVCHDIKSSRLLVEKGLLPMPESMDVLIAEIDRLDKALKSGKEELFEEMCDLSNAQITAYKELKVEYHGLLNLMREKQQY